MKKGHAFSSAANSYREFLSQLREYVVFLNSMFSSEWFFLSSCNTNFLFLLRYFFALLPCGISRFSFDRLTSFTIHDTSISIIGWKLKRHRFRGYSMVYPDSFIREFIFSLGFLFRLLLDFMSRLLNAFFNGLFRYLLLR